MSFFSGLIDFDNFDLGEIAKMPITQMGADFGFVKDVFSGDVSGAFGNHQDAMTDMQGSLGLNKDNKIVKNSDAIVGSIFGGILGGSALAGGMGGSAGGGGSGALYTGSTRSLATGATSLIPANASTAGGAAGGTAAGAGGAGSFTMQDAQTAMSLLNTASNLQPEQRQMELRGGKGALAYQTQEAPRTEKTYGGLI